jgi:hypothetical protein
MRRSAHDRAVAGELSKLKLAEVTPPRLKRLCDEIKEKRGPAVAVHVREIVLLASPPRCQSLIACNSGSSKT